MEGNIQHVAVVGLGKVGSLIAELLHFNGVKVTGFDQSPREDFYFETKSVDVTDAKALKKNLKDFDAVISCLPYFLNTEVAKIAMANKIHYFDLTEDVPHTKFIIENSKSSPIALVPQCGLAPGLIGIIGASMMREFDDVRSLELRVGALPRAPHGLLGYAINWSAEGIVNEYLNDAEAIRDGKKKTIPSLQEIETVIINGIKLEAFTTSGGLGTMTDTYEGRVNRLDYKTLRYPGHAKQMEFLFDELLLRDKRELVAEILLNSKPQTTDDVVYIYSAVEGHRNGELLRDTFVRAYHAREIHGKSWRAISWTTAASACAVIELVSKGVLPNKGYIRQEDIPYKELINTTFGRYYVDGVAVSHSSDE